jgi:hypothetical protein
MGQGKSNAPDMPTSATSPVPAIETRDLLHDLGQVLGTRAGTAG